MASEKKSARKGSFKGGALSGAALAVLAAALAGGFLNRSSASGSATDDSAAPFTIDGTYRVVTETGEPAAETSKGALDPHVMPEPMRRVAAGAALSGLLASMIALFGPNRILNMLASLGKKIARISMKAAEQPIRAAGVAARATSQAAAKVFRKPGQMLLIFAGLTIFTFTGISVMDIQWQAGLVAGAGVAGAAMYGWRKTGKAFSSLGNIWPLHAQKVAT